MAKLGDKFGEWVLRRRIGEGGQGQVFSASGKEGIKEVAIKIINTAKQKKRSRFIQEVSIHCELSEKKAKNIIPILDHNLEELRNGGNPGYIVMPMAATNLAEVRGLLAGRIEFCLEIFAGIVNGIRNAHLHGAIHRDIKPSNVLFLDRSMNEPLVSDFGICLLRDIQEKDRLTDVGETVGARHFMAPEQERGGVVDISPRADIYALGKLLHHLLTGRYLLREKLEEAFTPEEYKADSRYKIIHDRLLSITIIEDPEKRIQSAEELLKIVNDIRNGEIPDELDGDQSGGVDIDDATSQNVEFKELQAYNDFTNDLVQNKTMLLELEFDQLKRTFTKDWFKIHESIRNSPREAKTAASSLIIEQSRSTALLLAIARCNAKQLFQPAKRFIEFVTKASEGQSGYPVVFKIPHIQAGFLYMGMSSIALHCESWDVLFLLLTDKFEWYYQSHRPLFSYGFSHTYFFHPDAFNRSAAQAHDFYQERLVVDPVFQHLGLDYDSFLNVYVQVQFLMSLRGAQLIEHGDNIPLWPDYGRFYGLRFEPMLERIHNDDEYGTQVLRAFGESKKQFFSKLNGRFSILYEKFRGSNYSWYSPSSWEPN